MRSEGAPSRGDVSESASRRPFADTTPAKVPLALPGKALGHGFIHDDFLSLRRTLTSQITVNDIGSAEDFLAAIEGTIKNFNDGDLVSGIVVQVDREEVLLDIGYKTEGVIPSRELSIRHDIDPSEIVSVGDRVEALVLQKEDKEGRLILSKKRAQYERAWGEMR